MADAQKPDQSNALDRGGVRWTKVVRDRIRELGVGARIPRSRPTEGERRFWSELHLPWHRKW
jgi:hypothetical protein